MAVVLPPPTGDAKNPPDNVTVWGRLFGWLFLLWNWVTSTIPGRLTFGGDAGSYSAALFASAGQSDIGGLGMLPGATVVVGAQNTSGQTMTNNTTTIVTGFTSTVDTSLGAWNASTGVFTCRNPGIYFVSAKFRLANTNTGATFECTTVIRKNTTHTSNAEAYNAANNASAPTGTALMVTTLAQGDTIDVGVFHNSGANQTLNTAAQFGQFTLFKIG